MYEQERSFAGGLADRAADIGDGAVPGNPLEIRRKADFTVVTQADTSIESMVRHEVVAGLPRRPRAGRGGGRACRWRRTVHVILIITIDATADYARGIPIWHADRAAGARRAGAGAVYAPALNDATWLSVAGALG